MEKAKNEKFIMIANKQTLLCLVIFLFLGIDHLVAEEFPTNSPQGLNHSDVAKINSDLKKLNEINQGNLVECPSQEDKEDEEDKEQEQVANENSPIYALQGSPPKIFTKFSLKNDYFALPINGLRFGDTALNMEYPIIFDQGETHGYSVEFGFMPIPELRLSYSHASKLYTDIVGRGPNNEAMQTFTNEQLSFLTLDNLHTPNLITYKVDFGLVEHDKSNHTDTLRASTQQEWWHNDGSDEYMNQSFYQIINVPEEEYESGLILIPNIGINSNYLSKGKHFGSQARLYIAPELSTLSKRNNLELGLSSDIYLGTQVPALNVGKFKFHPINSIGFTLGGDLPVSIHQLHGDKTSKLSTSFTPRANIGANIGFNVGR